MLRGMPARQIAREHCDHELLGRVVDSLQRAGLSLQDATDLSCREARQSIADAIRYLDDTICEIRDHVLRDLDVSPPGRSS
jgi:hypothetical protein